MGTINVWETTDIRFPTSLELDGSDAMNPDPDYSAAYVSFGDSQADLIVMRRFSLLVEAMTFRSARSKRCVPM